MSGPHLPDADVWNSEQPLCEDPVREVTVKTKDEKKIQ